MRLLRAATAAICAAAVLPAPAVASAPATSQYPLPSGGAPSAGAFGADGNLWVTETAANKIARVTTSGSVTEFPVPTSPAMPEGIAAGADGNVWFVENTANAIAKVTTSGAITEYPIPSPASHPFDAAAGPDGNVWFTECSTDKVGRITPAGTITQFSLASGAAPEGIALGPDGNLWIAESGTNRIAALSSSGATLGSYATSGAPLNLAAGPDGAIWFTEQLSNKIGRITTGGTVTEYNSPTSSSGPFGIAAGPDGAIWFTEQFGNKIGRITTDGSQVSDWSLGAGTGPEEVVAGPDGRMWAADGGAGAVSAVKMLAPDASTLTPAAIAPRAATLSGTVNPNGVPTTYAFQYGPTSAYGDTTPVQAVSGSAGQTVSAPVLLTPASSYHYRVVATSASGSTYGPDQTFSTPAAPVSPGTQPSPSAGTWPPPPGQSGPAGGDPLGISLPTPVFISAAQVTVSARGDFVIEVGCPASAKAGCRGTVTVRAVSARARRARVVASRCARGCRPLGTGRYQARAGTRGRVRIRLAGFARAELARRGSMRVAVTVSTGSGAHVISTTRKITLKCRRARAGAVS